VQVQSRYGRSVRNRNASAADSQETCCVDTHGIQSDRIMDKGSDPEPRPVGGVSGVLSSPLRIGDYSFEHGPALVGVIG